MDRNTTIKLIIITKYHHSFITIGGNLLDIEHHRLLEKMLWDNGKFLEIDWQSVPEIFGEEGQGQCQVGTGR
jgi:hypothetical protein